MGKVETSNLLVKDLGKDVDTSLELLGLGKLNVLLGEGSILVLVEEDLSQDLVGEGARHDERRVASGTTQVNETTLGEEDDVVAVGHEEAVDLGLDVDDGLGVLLQPGNVNLDIEVTNV